MKKTTLKILVALALSSNSWVYSSNIEIDTLTPNEMLVYENRIKAALHDNQIPDLSIFEDTNEDVGASANNVKVVRNAQDDSIWYIKRSASDSWENAIPELFGSAIASLFLGPDMAPYNVVVKINGQSYAASKEIQDYYPLEHYDESTKARWFEARTQNDPSSTRSSIKTVEEYSAKLKELCIHSRAQYRRMAVAILLGQGNEMKNLGHIIKDGACSIAFLDFQNSHRYIHKFSAKKILEEMFPANHNELMDRIPTWNWQMFEGIEQSAEDTFVTAAELKFSFNPIYFMPIKVIRETISLKFYAFEWYFKELDLDIESEINKYTHYIEDMREMIKGYYLQDLEAAQRRIEKRSKPIVYTIQ